MRPHFLPLLKAAVSSSSPLESHHRVSPRIKVSLQSS